MSKGKWNVYVPSLTLRFEECQNIFVAYRSLYVTDELTGRVVEELNANLGDTTTGASPSEDLFKWNPQSENMIHVGHSNDREKNPGKGRRKHGETFRIKEFQRP